MLNLFWLNVGRHFFLNLMGEFYCPNCCSGPQRGRCRWHLGRELFEFSIIPRWNRRFDGLPFSPDLII